MLTITTNDLALCMGCNYKTSEKWVADINFSMAQYEINTLKRIAAFLATIGHETGGLRYVREIWGPTDTQKRYEGRKDLGNTNAGDGKRYLGRGLIQTTGRSNYELLNQRLSKKYQDCPNFVESPEKLEIPRWAAISAGDYWSMKGINKIADSGDFDGVSDVVNRGRKTEKLGDSNGWTDRNSRYLKILEHFS